MRRDDAALYLWAAGDEGGRERDSLERPVRSGAESFIAGTASCRIEVERVDDLFEEMRDAGVLDPASRGGVDETDVGTREFATLHGDGNLLTFFRWVGTPGRSEFAGEHRGRQAAADDIAAAVARAHGHEAEVELVEMPASGDGVALLVRERFGREGGTLTVPRRRPRRRARPPPGLRPG